VNNNELEKCWNDYYKHHFLNAKNKLIEHYYSRVITIAYKTHNQFANHNAEFQVGDLISYGSSGLIEAIEKYNPNNSAKASFMSFAYPRIKGSMVDGMRQEGSVKRRACEILRLYDTVRQELRSSLQREVSDEDIREALKLDDRWLDGWVLPPSTFSYQSDEVNSSLELEEHCADRTDALISNEPGADITAERKESWREFLKVCKPLLKPRELKVLWYYFICKLTLREIALKMGKAESRVSQIKNAMLEKLKEADEAGLIDLHKIFEKIRK
jgi:RNA polymerase sigma factor FliA